MKRLFVFLLCVLWISPSRAAQLTPFQKFLAARSRRVVSALKQNDTARLARFVDAQRGLRISTYSFAQKGDRVFSRAQVKRLKHDKRRIKWGLHPGSGEDIVSTWRDYRKQYVYKADFLRAPITFNATRLRADPRENWSEVFPNAIFVEFFDAGKPKQDYDFLALWLVWQKRGATWYLSGIASDYWTP